VRMKDFHRQVGWDLEDRVCDQKRHKGYSELIGGHVVRFHHRVVCGRVKDSCVPCILSACGCQTSADSCVALTDIGPVEIAE
jgi:hypothetical protein